MRANTILDYFEVLEDVIDLFIEANLRDGRPPCIRAASRATDALKALREYVRRGQATPETD
jgi:hypothetical protein